MSKLSYDEKIQLYNDRKNGMSKTALSKKYNICVHGIQYLCCLIDIHGCDILRMNHNKYYDRVIKQDAIERILNNNKLILSISFDVGLLGDGMLHNWIKKYKENGYNIVERKRGRSTIPKVTKKKENETDKDDKNKEAINKIKEIFINNKEKYGYRRITLELKNQGYNVNHKKVYRIMFKLGLKSLKRNKRKYSSYKGTVGKIVDNYINREFYADKPNQKWYIGVTEFNL